MSAMEPTTTSQPSTSEPTRANAVDGTEKPYGNRNFEPATIPEFIGPDFPIPASVAQFFRKLFRCKQSPATR
jgi:hypothetical protein